MQIGIFSVWIQSALGNYAFLLAVAIYLCTQGGEGEAAIPVSCKLHMVTANETYRLYPVGTYYCAREAVTAGYSVQLSVCTYNTALLE